MSDHITFVTPKTPYEYTEVMRITRDGVFVNPYIAVDDAAKTVLDALGDRIKVLVQKAVEEEREACARVLDEMAAKDKLSNYYKVAALAIREREDKND